MSIAVATALHVFYIFGWCSADPSFFYLDYVCVSIIFSKKDYDILRSRCPSMNTLLDMKLYIVTIPVAPIFVTR